MMQALLNAAFEHPRKNIAKMIFHAYKTSPECLAHLDNTHHAFTICHCNRRYFGGKYAGKAA